MEWRAETFTKSDDVSALAAEARAAFPHLDLNHDLTWLRASLAKPDDAIVVLTAREGGRLRGFAPLEVHKTSLRFGLSDLTIAAKRVTRYALESEPLLAACGADEDLAACFSSIADVLPSDGAVFLCAVPETSRTHALLSERHSRLREMFYVLPHGPRYQRCLIRWTGSFDTYLQSLGKVTRKDLRRTLRKADAEFGATLRLQRFDTLDAVEPFIRIARQVSDTTYQSTLLGLGISHTPNLKLRLSTMAQGGGFRGHVLVLDDAPVAFHYGYIHGKRFYMVDAGYDPRWAKAQMGMVMFLRMLQDLEAAAEPVTILDYLYGDGLYKQRTSNERTPQRHYYLLRRDARGALLAAAALTSDRVSQGLGSVADRLGAKAYLRRALRGMKSGPTSIAAWQAAAQSMEIM